MLRDLYRFFSAHLPLAIVKGEIPYQGAYGGPLYCTVDEIFKLGIRLVPPSPFFYFFIKLTMVCETIQCGLAFSPREDLPEPASSLVSRMCPPFMSSGRKCDTLKSHDSLL